MNLGETHIELCCFPFSWLPLNPFCFSVGFFFWLAPPLKRSFPRSAESACPMPPSSLPTFSPNPSSCSVFAVDLIAEQNPNRLSHPSFLVNKTHEHLHRLGVSCCYADFCHQLILHLIFFYCLIINWSPCSSATHIFTALRQNKW